MAKNLQEGVLLDFYGDLLTEKQKRALELYYNEDLFFYSKSILR